MLWYIYIYIYIYIYSLIKSVTMRYRRYSRLCYEFFDCSHLSSCVCRGDFVFFFLRVCCIFILCGRLWRICSWLHCGLMIYKIHNRLQRVNIVSFLVYRGGLRLGPLDTSVTNWPIVPAPDDRWVWSSRYNENLQGKPKYSEKTFPSVTLSTTNPTWPVVGSNLGRRCGKSATNRLSYGTTHNEHNYCTHRLDHSPHCMRPYPLF
jgi:hypothetical protein